MRKRFAAVLAVLFSVNLALLPVVDAARPLDPDPARATETSSAAAPAAAKRDDGKRDKGDRNKRRKDKGRNGKQNGSPTVRTNVPEISSGVVREPAGRMTTAAARGDRYIVVFRNENTDSQAVLDELMAATPGIVPTHVYGYLLSGFAAYLTPDAKQAIERDSRVASVEPDVEFELIDPLPTSGKARAARSGAQSLATEQTIPIGITRIGATRNSTAKIDGVDERVDADIAIIDTGVDLDHPDLNVFARVDCTPSPQVPGNDLQGHGTHVAGTAAAKDNGIGVVGVAPGARIWAYRVSDDSGAIWGSYFIACMSSAAYYSTHPFEGQTIDVANVSLGFKTIADGACASNTFHQSVCDAVAAGLTVVVSAGNDTIDAHGQSPATFDEVITVSNMADNDGKPGGVGGNFAYRCYTGDEFDDAIASSSNFGADVDIAAPGVDVLSTYPTDRTHACSPAAGYTYLSGTSMASPHVAGAAALIKARNPSYTPAEVKKALLDTRHDVPLARDPDGINEGILYVGPQDTGRPSVSIPRIGGGAGNGVTVNASDAGSGINRVELGYCPAPKKPKMKKGKKPKKPKQCEFYRARKIGVDPLAPFEFVWNPLPKPGSYVLIAWALDGSGNGQVARVPVTVKAGKRAVKRAAGPTANDATAEQRDNGDDGISAHDPPTTDGDDAA